MTARDRAIKLAARILNTTLGPSAYLEDHEYAPKRVPVKWWQWMYSKLMDAKEIQKRWAHELREIVEQGKVEQAAAIAERDALAVHVYNSGYQAGHEDTVEAVYTDVHQSDMDTYHADVVAELLAELKEGEG